MSVSIRGTVKQNDGRPHALKSEGIINSFTSILIIYTWKVVSIMLLHCIWLCQNNLIAKLITI